MEHCDVNFDKSTRQETHLEQQDSFWNEIQSSAILLKLMRSPYSEKKSRSKTGDSGSSPLRHKSVCNGEGGYLSPSSSDVWSVSTENNEEQEHSYEEEDSLMVSF
jgi:hypothetical protein